MLFNRRHYSDRLFILNHNHTNLEIESQRLKDWEMKTKRGLKWYQSIDLASRNCRFNFFNQFKEPWLFKQKKPN